MVVTTLKQSQTPKLRYVSTKEKLMGILLLEMKTQTYYGICYKYIMSGKGGGQLENFTPFACMSNCYEFFNLKKAIEEY